MGLETSWDLKVIRLDMTTRNYRLSLQTLLFYLRRSIASSFSFTSHRTSDNSLLSPNIPPLEIMRDLRETRYLIFDWPGGGQRQHQHHQPKYKVITFDPTETRDRHLCPHVAHLVGAMPMVTCGSESSFVVKVYTTTSFHVQPRWLNFGNYRKTLGAIITNRLHTSHCS